MSSEPRTWDEVLDAVERDAERAAALLATRSETTVPRLDSAPVLPALADMPSVPAHLRERIETLRDHITELQAELALALREWQHPGRPAPAHVAATPSYLDRLV